MKHLICLLLPALFFFNKAFAQNVRVYGYVQKTTRGTVPSKDFEENGAAKKIDNSSSEGYQLYFSTTSKNRLYPIEGWIKGERVGMKAELVASPVVVVNEKEEKITVVPKTAGKVFLLTGTELIAAKKFAKAETLAKNNEFVFVYRLNGKTNYAVVKKLQSLPTTHLQ